MANSDGRQPDYSVKSSEKYVDGENKVKYRSSFIGVGWKNTSKDADGNDEERINIKLHALPVNGELVLWPYKPRDES